MKISVVIPLYNKVNTIQRALNSVFNQTVQPEEVIVVNDGSTDNAEQIVAELNHPKVKILHQPNAGVSAARNRGVSISKGDWIAFLDADDEWLPEFLDTIIKLYSKYPQCSVLATSYFLQDHTGLRRKSVIKKLPFSDDDGLLTNYFMVAASSEPPINSSSVAINRSALESIGGFPTGLTSGEDLLTWARLASNNLIAYCTKPLSIFFLDSAYTYIDKPNRIPQIPDLVGMGLASLAKLNRRTPGIKLYVAHWHKMRASVYLRLGMKKEALLDSLKSLTFRPLNSRIFIYFIMLLLPKSLIAKIFKRFGNT